MITDMERKKIEEVRLWLIETFSGTHYFPEVVNHATSRLYAISHRKAQPKDSRDT